MKRHSRELKEMVGSWLRRDPRRGTVKILAESLRVDPKTLNNWKRKVPQRAGRPRYSNTQRRAALIAVARELKQQGYPGESAIASALPHVPLRLIREYVAKLKARKRARLSLRQRKARVSVRVKATHAILAQDGAHLGRDHGKPIEAQIAKDRASQRIVTVSIGPPTEQHVLIELEKLKQTRGLPLVWSTDNGSAYCGERVALYLEQERVIHLRNLPRTPQHNGAIERTVREVKETSALRGWSYDEAKSAGAVLGNAACVLNSKRLRGGNSECAIRIDEKMLPAYNLVNRERFYAECRKAMCEARSASVSRRRNRLAERNAVFATLERHQLVEITTGGR